MEYIAETKNGKKPAQHITSAVAVNSQRERDSERERSTDQQGTEFRSGILLTNVATGITVVFTCEGKQGSVDAECLN